MRGNIFFSMNCDICGKEFFPTSEWVYKFYTKDNIKKMFCSWKCFNIGISKYKRIRKERISDEVKRKNKMEM